MDATYTCTASKTVTVPHVPTNKLGKTRPRLSTDQTYTRTHTQRNWCI